MERPASDELHALVDEFFYPGPTADIGCGDGSLTAWLGRHGLQAIGFDADEALVEAARRAHPEIDFAVAALPDLPGVPPEVFTNVVCERALAGLPPEPLTTAVDRLLEILAADGTLLLSLPGPAAEGDTLPGGLEHATILHESTTPGASSDQVTRRLVARKHGR